MSENKKRRSYTIETKLAVLDYFKMNSIEKNAKHFKVDPKTVRDWRKQREELENLKSISSSNAKQKRLEGGGVKVHSEELETRLCTWILNQRDKRLCVSQKMVQTEALKLFKELDEGDSNKEFKASDGWLQQFFKRNEFVLCRRTTISQKAPVDITEKIVNFILYLRRLCIKNQYSDKNVFCMDKTPIWVEPVANNTIKKTGSKEVPIKSTGHENVCFTVVLSAWQMLQN